MLMVDCRRRRVLDVVQRFCRNGPCVQQHERCTKCGDKAPRAGGEQFEHDCHVLSAPHIDNTDERLSPARPPRGSDHLRIAAVDRLPIEIAEPGIDIPGCLGAVVHVETVLVHIQHQQRNAGGGAVHMIPCPMIVE